MKELHNFIYKHMDTLKHHKRYLAMLTALSMLVTFIVPLILIEPADSMSGKLICNMVEHVHNDDCYIGGMLNCSVTEEHIHTEDCYKKFSLFNFKKATQQLSEGQNSHVDNVTLSNAAGIDDHVFVEDENATVYSPNNVPLYVLLFGEGDSRNWVDPTKSLEENLEIANSEYFLGFASDFCAFIEGDFKATEADAEGRVAVGGDIIFTKDWNYQIGSGDYVTMKPLDEIDGYTEYENVSGYASAIVGGKMVRVNTLSTGWGSNRNDIEDLNPSKDSDYHRVNVTDKYSYTVYYKPEDGLYKSFIVGNVGESSHYDKASGTDIPYGKECQHDYPADCLSCTAKEGEDMSSNPHHYLSKVNEKAQLYPYDKVNELFDKTFSTIRGRSLVLSKNQGTVTTGTQYGEIIFDGSNVPRDASTVYFTVEDWLDYRTIKFKNIPENANVVVNCGATDKISIAGTYDERKANPDANTNVSTSISTNNDDNWISKSQKGYNNDPNSARILYNFYNASELEINGNFNGTILAPNADVKSFDGKCPGHLSGALIAKSFYGSLEFGYRPYRGGNDILGMTSGYEVPVEKFYSNTKEYLPGAVFTVNELLEDNNKKYLSSFNSSGDKDFIALPSQVDYSGKTLYMPRTEKVGTVTTTAVTKVTVNTTLNTTTEPINPMELTFTNSVSSDNKNVQYEIKNFPQGANTYRFYLGDNQIAELQNATGNWQYNNEKTGNLKIKVVAYKDGQEIAESYAILTVEGLTLQASFEGENIVAGTTNVNLALTNIPDKTRKVIYKIDNVDHVVEKTDEDIDFSYVFVPTENKECTIEATAYDESNQILAKTETYVDATIEIELPEPEEPQTNDMLIINVPDDKTLAGLKLNLQGWDNCKVNVNYYDANNVLLNQTPNTCSNNTDTGSNCINIPYSVENSDSRIAKVVIEVIEGIVSLASYDITYAASSNASTTIEPVGEILENGQTKSFKIDNAENLYSFTLTTKSNDQNLPSGSKFRYTLHNADGVINGHSDIECQFDGTSNYKTIILNDIQGITKIDIKADGTSIPIESYSVTKLVDNDYTLEESQIEPKTITKQYIIEEEQPPLGFFEIDYCYKITVEEKVDRSQVYNKYYPEKVDTEITIQKVKKDDYSSSYDDSTSETLSFTIENNYADTGNTRTITIGETVFTIKIGVDGNITSVSKDGTEIENPPSVLDGNYYFNPDTAMIVPMPENSVAFNNSPGLLFRKVGENGVAISGVEIQLKAVNGDVEECGWTWNKDNSSECLIDVSKLTTGKVYYFEEINTFGKYEKAPNIYFQKVDADTIVYWTGGETRPESVNTLNLKENRTIRMTNTPFPGIKLNLKKVHYNSGFTNTTLSGAKFALYAKDDSSTPICSEVVTDADGNISFNLPADNPYVASGNGSNGTYLKPGVYYLTETELPDIPENLKPDGVGNPVYASPGNIYFTVKDDFTVVSGYQNVESLGFEKKDNQIGFVTFNGQKLNGGATSIPNIVSFKFYITAPNTLQIYTSLIEHDNGNNKKNGKGPNECLTDETYNGTAVKVYQYTTDVPTNVSKFEIQNHGNNDIANEIKYIELVDSNGKKYVYSSSGNTTDFVFKNPMLAPNFEKTLDTNTVTLTVGNKINKENIDITVNKKWAGDTNFESFRKDVKLRLYRTITELNGTNPDFSNTSLEEVKGDGITNPVTLKASTNAPNDANTWTYTWSGLPIADEDYNTYYYYVKEETELPEYVTTYSKTGEDVITITNTLKTVDIPVEKRWIGDYANVTRPSAITLQLQSKKTGTENLFADVPGKTLTLTADDNWQGTFEDLPEGYDYQVVETHSGSNSWASMTNYETVGNNIKIVVTNTLEVGSLKITKSWSGSEESADSRPKQLKFRIYRSTVSPYYTESDVSTVDVTEDYARLLQYSLYFYDANMCGNDVSENSKIAWRSNCHTNDEVPGGYHDAGDHVVFGLPQGYAASMLGWSYYEFIKTVTNPNNPINEYDVAHYKLILDRFYDFFSRSVKYKDGDSSKEVEWLLVQKGNGNIDHGYWGPPENQSRNNATEMYWRNDTGADIAAEYAAALALGYLNFYDVSKPDDPENAKYRNYLTLAKKLYDYAERVKNDKNGDRTWKMEELNKYADGCLNKWGINLDETQKDDRSVPYPGFYLSDSCTDDMALAAGWLCLASEKAGDDADVISKYESACKNDTPGWAFSWNDVSLAAACVYAHVKEDDNTVSDPWQNARTFINNNKDKNSPFYRPDTNKCWGSARYNAALQMAALVVDKNDTQANYNDWAKSQMDMILGDNRWAKDANGNPTSVCLITGFADNSAKNAHHRAASGWESIGEYKDPTHTTYDTDGKTLIGAMVGGPYFGVHSEAQMEQNDHDNLSSSATHGDYLDDLHDYCCNEVAIDYQAGLVGAALGLYYFNGTGERSEKIEGVEIEGGSRDNTEAYPATANANVFDMVSFNMPRVAVMDDETPVSNPMTSVDFDHTYNVNLENVTKIKVTVDWNGIGDFNFNIHGNLDDNQYSEWDYQLQIANHNYNSNNGVYECNLNNPSKVSKMIIGEKKDNNGSVVSISKIEFVIGTSPPTSTDVQITNSPEKDQIIEGHDFTFTSNNDVSWSVVGNNSEYASFENGSSKLIAKNVKNNTEITIKATKNDDNSKYAEKTITILPVTISGDNVITVGDGEHLLSVDGGSEFTWTSSDTNKVKINSSDGTQCKIQAVNPDSATIKVSKNGQEVATYNITVRASSSSGGTESGGENMIDGLYVINSITPNDNIIVKDKTIDIGDMNAIISDHPVKKIMVEFENSSGNYNGFFFWDEASKKSKEVEFRSDSYSGTQTIFDKKFNYVFDTAKQFDDLDIYCAWNDGDAKIKKIYFLTDNPQPTVLNVPSKMLTGDEVTVKPFGFGEGSEITWTVTNESGTEVENAIVDGKFKPTSKGTYTIKATAGDQEATVTVNVERSPFTISIDKTQIRQGSEAILSATEEGVTYEATGGASELVEITGNKVKLKSESLGNESISVKIKGTATDREMSSNEVDLTILGNLYISGEGKMASGYTQTLTAGNVLDNVTWDVKNVDGYTIDRSGNEIITVKSGDDMLFNVNKTNGEVTAVGSSGTITVIATDTDRATAEFDIKIDKVPVRPVLPDTSERELVTEVIMNSTDSWTKTLSNLPLKDSKGNTYYYYVEEYAYTYDTGNDPQWKVLSTTGGYITGTNATYIPISYSGNGVAIDKNDIKNVTIGNEMIAKVQGQLPSTGGSGVKTYYYIGGAIMLLGIAGFTGIKRRERKRRKE